MHRQPVPHAWACCSEASVTKVVGPWDDARPGGGRTQLTAIAVGSELDVVGGDQYGDLPLCPAALRDSSLSVNTLERKLQTLSSFSCLQSMTATATT